MVTVLYQKTSELLQEVELDPGVVGWWINRTTVTELEPHTSYIIRIQAKNKAGLSKTSAEVFVKTRCKSQMSV